IICNLQSSLPLRMLDAGAIRLCITNVPEVCMGWETMNTIYGRSKNSYDTRRITGGSSGGEAALVASAGSLIGVGSDIGGSIRMPSFFNGVFRLKPTPGVITLEGRNPVAHGYRTEMRRYRTHLQIRSRSATHVQGDGWRCGGGTSYRGTNCQGQAESILHGR
ncbi:hypothetical protein PMAYCL1PPCAC_24754, partial [Pristionchus mayeri]